MSENSVNDLIDSLKITDCDSHFTEPPDLWSSRVTGKMADRMPVMKTVNGISAWYVDGEVWASVGGNVIGHGGERIPGARQLQPFDAIDPAAWSVPERLALLDKEGIWGQVLYPNGIGFASNHIFAIDDVEQRTATLQAYNDWMADVQEQSKGRLFPQGLLPVWDMDLTVKEMTRLLDRGMRGFTLSDKPEMIDLPELPESYFDPMWDIFNESGAAVNFHIASGRTKAEMEGARAADLNPELRKSQRYTTAWNHFVRDYPQRRYLVNTSQSSFSNIRIIANLCVSNIFDRYPKLKVVSVESGIGWVPFLLEELDYCFDDIVTSPEELAYAKRRPVEYFYDHIYTMFWFEKSAPERLLDLIGPKHVMVETDLPHPSCVYPGAKAHFVRVLGQQSPEVIRDVLQDNAARLYNIQVG
jgi:predicted TIM-barrel fold metal-dependent hydrolase